MTAAVAAAAKREERREKRACICFCQPAYDRSKHQAEPETALSCATGSPPWNPDKAEMWLQSAIPSLDTSWKPRRENMAFVGFCGLEWASCAFLLVVAGGRRGLGGGRVRHAPANAVEELEATGSWQLMSGARGNVAQRREGDLFRRDCDGAPKKKLETRSVHAGRRLRESSLS